MKPAVISGSGSRGDDRSVSSVPEPFPVSPLSVALARSYEAIRASRRLLDQAKPFPFPFSPLVLAQARQREPKD